LPSYNLRPTASSAIVIVPVSPIVIWFVPNPEDDEIGLCDQRGSRRCVQSAAALKCLDLIDEGA
jgi:hypothetical protein